jgi:thioredoxin reductase
MTDIDVAIIGGGPAGLAAAIAAKNEGASPLIIEREAHLGGILKQCIHDGFGLIRFGEKLSGPEYVERYIDEARSLEIPAETLTFVTRIKRKEDGFSLSYVNREGVHSLHCRSLILATGCRERTAKQVSIHGTRPAGVYTAGTAQSFVNLQGLLPTKRCVILGSGDIGLIMARRLTLEGVKVVGVYEAKSTPSGLTRNIVQCLEDYDIPLHLSTTVVRVFGQDRLEGVVLSKVDEKMQPIEGTEETVLCDSLILSVGLIPENEMAEKLGVTLSKATKGPITDSRLMTSVPGVFVAGNAWHVNDLVDYVSESGARAGKNAALYARSPFPEGSVPLNADSTFGYLVPQGVRKDEGTDGKLVVYFRSRKDEDQATLEVRDDTGALLFKRPYRNLKPPEMQRLEIPLKSLPVETAKEFRVHLSTEKGEQA